MVNLFFAFLSAAYIAAIFLLADSPMVSALSAFNPYSLLHIPLYGILSILLILTVTPFRLYGSLLMALRSQLTKRLFFSAFGSKLINGLNGPNVLNVLNALTHQRFYASTRGRILISGIIAFMVGVADEYHQSFIPSREASGTDVLLDGIGIILAIAVMLQLVRRQLLNDPTITR